MTPNEKLAEIKELIRFKLYNVAAKKVDELYEDFTCNRIQLTEKQEWLMFSFIDTISNAIYLGMEA